MSRLPGRSNGRFLLAALLAVASLGWVDDATSAASPPAELISTAPGSNAPDPIVSSYSSSISGDGNIVVFDGSSFVSTLAESVYVRNRSAGTTTAVPSIALGALTTGGVVSRDGCHVAFLGYTPAGFVPARWDVYAWNRCTAGATPVRIAPTTGLTDTIPYFDLAISGDGRYVAYVTTPTSGGAPHIARIDTGVTPVTESVLISPVFGYADSIDISDDGKFVAVSGQVVIGNLPTNQIIGWTAPCANTCTTEVVSLGPSGQPLSGSSSNPSVSADGRYVAFQSDTADVLGAPPGSRQVYVRDRVGGVTRLVTDTPGKPMVPNGEVGEADITPDGTQIALVEVDVGETGNVWVARSTSGYFNTATFDLVSYGVSGDALGPNGASSPSISTTGRFVTFHSGNSTELSGGAVPEVNEQSWLRSRPISLGATAAVDFGTVDVGSQSGPKNAVITNTGLAEVTIGSVTVTPGSFSVSANGCVGVLPAGASCSVTLVFQPTAAGAVGATLTVVGDGVPVTTALTGTGRTPTGPTPGFLTIKPISASFGSGPIGTSFPAKKFVVTNPGQSAVAIASVTLNGDSADQFAIVSNGCTGSLAAGGSCTVQVSATVTRDGVLSATLDVLGGGGQAAHATLRLGGEFTPTLKMNPGVISVGKITAAIGDGFPPNIDVQLAFEGEAPFATVHTDGGGSFQFMYLLVTGVRIGGRQVIAVDQAQFSGVRAPLLIELPNSKPSGFSSPQFTNGVRSLVYRGG